MPLNRTRVRSHLQTGNFRRLFFEELGWDTPNLTPQSVDVDGRHYTLQPIAQKRGVYAFQLALPAIPLAAERRKIEQRLVRNFREHFILFTTADSSQQVWQWVLREPGRTAGRSHEYRTGQSGESLIQKLERIAFTLEQEENIDTLEVVGSVYAAFNVERATGRFYDRFKRERDAFQKFLTGIPDEEMARWYVSVMLNRLMFIYFIQQKGFLAGDRNYLRSKLNESQQRGQDRYYRDFLCPLFFAGFATPLAQRTAEMRTLLGNVPYLNGGIFERHEVEQRHGQTIRIPDRAFANLFDFFDAYQWHLDDRPLRNDNEINPDVLGYIFEKYINQKQMGAYYTKEDITEYISKNTIIPFLFDAAQKKYPAAFKGERSVWRLLSEDPDRYLYEAVRKGIERDLPPAIAAGIKDVSARGQWNTPTPDDYALPTEIWRETVARRQRYEELWLKLAGGEVQAINDLITYNLDIRQFAQDVIESCEDPDLLRAFWTSIRDVTVLDPTCGSGAFLFAALNILEPLYEACLERMEHFVAGLPPGAHPEKFRDFRQVLAEIDRHPNERYFIYKSIIVNNLYGVDIMHEAVEIAKLRLFLKLAALVEIDERKPNFGIEPLPDIDFNIRAGNTLVGFATREQMVDAVRGNKLLLLPEEEEALARIEEQAADAERLFARFRAMQTHHELGQQADDYAQTKAQVRKRLAALAEELNRLLALQYGVNPDKLTEYPQWLDSHQPFHWFVEFYGIMNKGGFDVIIGNPPWKEYSAVRRQYTVRQYVTEPCGNLYALCSERAIAIRSSRGIFSFIVQLPLVSSSRMRILRELLARCSSSLHVIPFDDRPGKLFSGLQHCRSAIFISTGVEKAKVVRKYLSKYQRWYSESRPTLFDVIQFIEAESEALLFDEQYPKYENSTCLDIFRKVVMKSVNKIGDIRSQRQTRNFIFYQEATQYWVKAVVGLPYYRRDGIVGAPSHGRYMYFAGSETAHSVCALMHSSLFYLYFISYGDCFHLSQTLCDEFRIMPSMFQDRELAMLGSQLVDDLKTNAGTTTIQTKDGYEITYAEYYGAKSKSIIDQIDAVLAKHLGFSDVELDYIQNYDIKYRMGDALAGDEGEE